MANGCHRCGGICCLQLKVACLSPERRYHHQSTRRHSPEDRKIRIKRFYLFESQTEKDIGKVQQLERGRGHDEITHSTTADHHAFPFTHSKFALTIHVKVNWNFPTSCFRLQNPVIHNYKETLVATSQVAEEARCNPSLKLLIKKAVTINKALQRNVLQKLSHSSQEISHHLLAVLTTDMNGVCTETEDSNPPRLTLNSSSRTSEFLLRMRPPCSRFPSRVPISNRTHFSPPCLLHVLPI